MVLLFALALSPPPDKLFLRLPETLVLPTLEGGTTPSEGAMRAFNVTETFCRLPESTFAGEGAFRGQGGGFEDGSLKQLLAKLFATFLF